MAYLHVGFSYLKEMKILTLTPFTTFVLALVSPPILGCIIIWYMHPAAEKVYHLGFKPENSLVILVLRLPFIRKPLKWNSMLYSSLCRCQFLCLVLKYFVLCYYDVDYRSQALCGPFGEGERFLLCKITGYRNTLSNSRIGKSSCKDFWTSYFDHITFLFFFFFFFWNDLFPVSLFAWIPKDPRNWNLKFYENLWITSSVMYWSNISDAFWDYEL